MQYIVKNKDSSVVVVTVLPVGLIELETGKQYVINGLTRKNGNCIIYGDVDLVVGDETYDIADLKDDSVPGFTILFPDLEKDILAKWHDYKRDAVETFDEIEKADLPEDRYFRNAWEYDGELKVNMEKAKEIHKNKLRVLRQPVLEKLDTEYIRADEAGDTTKKQEIAELKQELRDITKSPEFDAVETLEDIKNITLPDGR